MKRFSPSLFNSFIFSAASLLLLLNACTQVGEISQQGANAADTLQKEKTKPQQKLTINDQAKAIASTSEGHFRGISLGDKAKKVLETETSSLEEENESYISYTFVIEQPEKNNGQESNTMEGEKNQDPTADLRYLLSDQKRVSGIEMEIFLNSQEQLDSTRDALITWLTTKTDQQPVVRKRKYSWIVKDQVEYQIAVVDKKITPTIHDYGLRVYIKPLEISAPLHEQLQD